jgi:hypothetical protein
MALMAGSRIIGMQIARDGQADLKPLRLFLMKGGQPLGQKPAQREDSYFYPSDWG